MPLLCYNLFLIVLGGNESQSMLTFRETTTKPYLSLPSFRWDTFVNYGEVSSFRKYVSTLFS